MKRRDIAKTHVNHQYPHTIHPDIATPAIMRNVLLSTVIFNYLLFQQLFPIALKSSPYQQSPILIHIYLLVDEKE